MGSAITQPQRVRRARRAEAEVSLFADFASLVMRLLVDRRAGGRTGDIARAAVLSAFDRIITARAARIPQAGPRLLQRLGALARALTGVGASVRIAAPADALDVGHTVLAHFAVGLEGLKASQVRPHVIAFLDILETDLGFSVRQAEAELASVIGDIIDRLESAPPEADERAREVRLETACLLRRIRMRLGDLPFPRLDADLIAQLIVQLFASVKAPAFAARLRCIANALETAARTGQSIEALVPIGTFAEFRSLGAAAAATTAD
jgi:hypothetical protein